MALAVKTSRFAPSPTGRLHLGHAYSAVVGRAAGERFRLRIEDLDVGRCRAEFVDGIFEDLRWLGIEWDGDVLVQSGRREVYVAALDRLREQGLVYPCFCTRSDIAAAMSAPHAASTAYPGTCRGGPDDPARRHSESHSWRLDGSKAMALAGFGEPVDDVILARKDAPAAYHLACVIDDAASGVDLVVRGADLLGSTPVQRLLQDVLGLPRPDYLHHPLVAHSDGRRLAKRDRAPTLAAMREAGIDGRALAARLGKGELPLGFRFIQA